MLIPKGTGSDQKLCLAPACSFIYFLELKALFYSYSYSANLSWTVILIMHMELGSSVAAITMYRVKFFLNLIPSNHIPSSFSLKGVGPIVQVNNMTEM